MGIMGDTFTEVIVPVKRNAGSYALQTSMVILTVFCLGMGMFAVSLLMWVGAALIAADWFVFRRLNLEYEYSYANGDLDIAKIYSKQTRKNVCSIALADVIAAAPEGSSHLDSYRKLPTIDYTTGTAEDMKKAFVIVANIKDKPTRLLLMPNEKIMKDMRTRGANKVFLN
ncbi:MAG: DUF6106 family protein [Eubacteriales bacterium]|nr:DUF6106 family protein [Eubacteriales bacterium]